MKIRLSHKKNAKTLPEMIRFTNKKGEAATLKRKPSRGRVSPRKMA